MTLEMFVATMAFAFVTSITPGPNNSMLLVSGVNYGFARTIPHIMGINLGFPFMLVAIGLGLGGVFAALPVLHQVLQVLGALYLLYLAWNIATAGTMKAEGGIGKPMTFLQAAAFQWVNPKAWIIAMGAITTYVPSQGYLSNVVILALIYAMVNLPCIAAWTGFGVFLKRLLSRPKHVHTFNIAMAVMLVLSLYPLIRM
jgi:threonine/homoserine/homoserine lactone efflux protein